MPLNLFCDPDLLILTLIWLQFSNTKSWMRERTALLRWFIDTACIILLSQSHGTMNSHLEMCRNSWLLKSLLLTTRYGCVGTNHDSTHLCAMILLQNDLHYWKLRWIFFSSLVQKIKVSFGMGKISLEDLINHCVTTLETFAALLWFKWKCAK